MPPEEPMLVYLSAHDRALLAAEIAAQLGDTHKCRFDDDEAKNIHAFANALSNGGLEGLRGAIEFGQAFNVAKSAGIKAIVTVFVMGVIGLIIAGLATKLGKG